MSFIALGALEGTEGAIENVAGAQGISQDRGTHTGREGAARDPAGSEPHCRRVSKAGDGASHSSAQRCYELWDGNLHWCIFHEARPPVISLPYLLGAKYPFGAEDVPWALPSGRGSRALSSVPGALLGLL